MVGQSIGVGERLYSGRFHAGYSDPTTYGSEKPPTELVQAVTVTGYCAGDHAEQLVQLLLGSQMLAGGDKRSETEIPQPVPLIEVIHPAVMGVVVISVVFYADAVIRVGDIHLHRARAAYVVNDLIIDMCLRQPVGIALQTKHRFLRGIGTWFGQAQGLSAFGAPNESRRTPDVVGELIVSADA